MSFGGALIWSAIGAGLGYLANGKRAWQAKVAA